MSSLVINEKLIKSDDTGWTNISLQNGWASMSGRPAQYRKIGNVVYLRTNGNFVIDLGLPGNKELTIGCNFIANS